MGINIYNTLTGQKEEFQPLEPGKVGMYVCGVTVYDDCHLGHARGAVTFDIIRRYMEYKGYKVTYVRNFTDVDDKIIERAREKGISWDTLAETFIKEYRLDMGQLGVRDASSRWSRAISCRSAFGSFASACSIDAASGLGGLDATALLNDNIEFTLLSGNITGGSPLIVDVYYERFPSFLV